MINNSYQSSGAPPKYYAHSGREIDCADWQRLKDHLEHVASLAQARAQIFGAGDCAHLIGLLHDLGKYSKEFQARLHGDPARADHATAGGKIVVQHLLSLYGDTKEAQAFAKLLAFAIAGHHAGLANGIDEGQQRSTLQQRLSLDFGQGVPALDEEVWRQEIALPQSLRPPVLKRGKHDKFCWFFLTRMLFSCLIDADRIDTENYTRSITGRTPLVSAPPSIATLQSQLNQYLQALAKNVRPSLVNTLRQHILVHTREQAVKPRDSGLYSLTVPTGGGKTLASLAFGLDHAAAHPTMRRVIYVIPFTSIIEQTTDVFRKAMGEHKDAVLEHHSAFDRDKLPEELKVASKPRQADYRDKLRLAMESWDAPIVVTTAVQFFESLFSDRPSQCRKLHNIAGSVIVLDEAQTLPLKLLRPVMAAIDELALNYGCSVVLCTATQPALQHGDFHNGFKNVQEIAPNPSDLFGKLRRTQVQFLGEQSDDELVAHLRRHAQVLMIVNNRRHARVLFDAIANDEGAYHLTTSLCAEHRSQQLAEIRQRLKAGQPCRLVATSLIEAGVDVDFPTVYRAEAGLDSIAQAAGRCNREGRRLLEESQVFVFQSPDWKAPPELAQLAAPMRSILRNYEGDVLAPEAMKSYFQQVYYAKGADLDHHQILTQIRATEDCDFPFQNIARDFRMIDSNMLPVIVPFDKVAEENLALLRHLPENMSVSKPARKLQRYVVQVPQKAFVQLLKLGAVAAIAPEKFGSQFYELVAQSLYSPIAGLNFSDPVAMSAESSVF